MTKQETIQIMAMLGAFYAGGKNDPKMQAEAWYMILQKYDYDTAKIAVLNFAENDTRDYATFPAVGKIVDAIKTEDYKRNKPIWDIKMAISYGKKYDDMSPKCKSIISRETYNNWLKVDPEEFENKAGDFVELLKRDYGKRLIAGI